MVGLGETAYAQCIDNSGLDDVLQLWQVYRVEGTSCGTVRLEGRGQPVVCSADRFRVVSR
jgi:hypothetical protein